ncbi:MAG: hypothetical protein M1819_003505 [Sarea resinae]|nr:MAG: hypothetical protein M1819_003505 [Sarea resinae]
MAGKKAAGENSKKVAGNAKKAEAAAQKKASEDAVKRQAEDSEWSKGAKSNSKKQAAEDKKAEAAKKKAEKDALLREEEASLPSKAPKGAKTATKKTRGLDLSQLDDNDPSNNSKAAPTLSATGIDNALDALSLDAADTNSAKIDRHPERRFKAAYAAFEARRLPELEEEQKGLRRQQRIDIIRKEFEKSSENPFNQVSARFDSTREEIAEMKAREKEKTEKRLAAK